MVKVGSPWTIEIGDAAITLYSIYSFLHGVLAMTNTVTMVRLKISLVYMLKVIEPKMDD